VRWSARWANDEGGHDIPKYLALSPDGSTLYVHGSEHMNPVGEGADFATVAYEAATGDRLWASSYDGGPDDTGYGVTVSPDGAFVYVTGKSGKNFEDTDYATVAYHADTGDRAWAARWSAAPGASEDIGLELVATNDAVFVGGTGGSTIATLAYRAGDPDDDPRAGGLLWESDRRTGFGYHIALSPDGSTVYTTGSAHVGVSDVPIFPDWSYTSIAYDADTGAIKWQATWAAPLKGFDVPYGHALSPDGATLYVTGQSRGIASELDNDGTTVAFNTSDGSVRWTATHAVPGSIFECSCGAVVSPDSKLVYVTGWSATGQAQESQIVSLAYDSADGSQEWIARYWLDDTAPSRSPGMYDFSLVMSPDGKRLVAASTLRHAFDPADPLNQDMASVNSSDYVVVGYETADQFPPP
jgi:DNA-binding beta-propeller fold protein YncE